MAGGNGGGFGVAVPSGGQGVDIGRAIGSLIAAGAAGVTTLWALAGGGGGTAGPPDPDDDFE